MGEETCSTICGTPVQAIFGNILTFPDPPCQPGQIFLVQNGLYRCPTCSTTCFMSNSHLWGVFLPFRGTDFIMGKNKNANFSKRARCPIFKFCVVIREAILQKMAPILDPVNFFSFLTLLADCDMLTHACTYLHI